MTRIDDGVVAAVVGGIVVADGAVELGVVGVWVVDGAAVVVVVDRGSDPVVVACSVVRVLEDGLRSAAFGLL